MDVIRLEELKKGEIADVVGYDEETPLNLKMRFAIGPYSWCRCGDGWAIYW